MTSAQDAARLSAELDPAAAVLEWSPGPGYLAVEMAVGRLRVTGSTSATPCGDRHRACAESGGEGGVSRATSPHCLRTAASTWSSARRRSRISSSRWRPSTRFTGSCAPAAERCRGHEPDATNADVAVEVRAMKLSPVRAHDPADPLHDPAPAGLLPGPIPAAVARASSAPADRDPGIGLEVSLTKDRRRDAGGPPAAVRDHGGPARPPRRLDGAVR